MQVRLKSHLQHDGKGYACGAVIDTDAAGMLPHQAALLVEAGAAEVFALAPAAVLATGEDAAAALAAAQAEAETLRRRVAELERAAKPANPLADSVTDRKRQRAEKADAAAPAN